jgi:Uridine kinase
MDNNSKKPIVLAFAGPNGSGKSTVTRGLPVLGTYVNADDIKKDTRTIVIMACIFYFNWSF